MVRDSLLDSGPVLGVVWGKAIVNEVSKEQSKYQVRAYDGKLMKIGVGLSRLTRPVRKESNSRM